MTPAELKAIRLSIGLSQVQFGKLIGKTNGTLVSRYESGALTIPKSVEIILTQLGKIPAKKDAEK